jgi:Putative MetA-pathway of phenol degradation
MKPIRILFLVASCIYTLSSYGQQTDADAPLPAPANTPACNGSCCCDGNSQAPLGVMTDHIHNKGQWMLTYTFMNTMMSGNQMGTSKATDDRVYQNYMMAPETMSMQMHMLMAMYGITDHLTVMAMGGYMTNSMSMNMDPNMMSMPGMVMPMGNTSMTSTSSGLTDTKVSALYNFSKIAAQRIIGSIGISIPTGTIRATGTTILGDGQRLPYDMQTGTGSFAIDPDITYAHKHNSFYWGANAGADIKLNNNSLGYRYGNTYHATAWAGYQLLPFLSATFRAEDVMADKISGSDGQLANQIYQENDPTTVTANYGGNWVNTYVGLNFYMMKPVLEHFRFMAEYGMPVYQNLNGTQMALHNDLFAGVQYSF